MKKIILEGLFYTVQDPAYTMPDGGAIPAVTTLLLKVCKNDHEAFDEAVRVIGLFTSAAYDLGKAAK